MNGSSCHCFSVKNAHLLVSLVLVVSAALMYGLAPTRLVPGVFDIAVETVDLANVFRAIMCLYLAISGLWLLAMLRPGLWRIATVSNVVFMGSLVLGRLISLVVDGTPSAALLYAVVVEALLGVFGFLQLRRYRE